jgi:hypothetical protein
LSPFGLDVPLHFGLLVAFGSLVDLDVSLIELDVLHEANHQFFLYLQFVEPDIVDLPSGGEVLLGELIHIIEGALHTQEILTCVVIVLIGDSLYLDEFAVPVA